MGVMVEGENFFENVEWRKFFEGGGNKEISDRIANHNRAKWIMYPIMWDQQMDDGQKINFNSVFIPITLYETET